LRLEPFEEYRCNNLALGWVTPDKDIPVSELEFQIVGKLKLKNLNRTKHRLATEPLGD
jgi:hypothetical protein